eukprot:PITA_04819
MDEEINAIERNKTWDLVELPKGKEVIGVKWVYKTKSNADGKIEHKARLVFKGYKQQYGRDYEETFVPVARMETVRALLSIAAQNKWKVYQMDVKSALLNGVLMEEVYIEQPLGYEKKGQEHKVCRLKKAIYGLKQAPRLQERGTVGQIPIYWKMDLKSVKGNPPSTSKKMMERKAAIASTVMGLKLSKEDNNKDFDPSLYKSIVGSLMYLTATRLDIMHAVSLISRFMESPKEAHWQATKRILRYVKDDRKSISSYVFHMGSGAISWASKNQPIVALSTTEAKYVAATVVVCQAIWMRRMLRSLCQEQAKGIVIFCDNSSAIALSNNSVFHKRTKHIDTKFHYIRELVNNGEIVLEL